MSHRIKLVILGGSALATPLLFEALARSGARAAYQAVLVGRDAERLELVARVAQDLLTRFPDVDIQISASSEAATALEGADYCLNQVRVGGLEGRAFDETFPRQFGLPGEETLGPGGFSSSLRGIPVVLEHCRLIEEVAPRTLVLNLTNPSSVIQYAMRRYSSVQVIGLCELPVLMMERIAELLGAPRSALQFELAGMNHFTWISAVREAGRDRMPEVLDRVNELPKLGADPELVRAIGAIPSPFLRYYFHPDRVLAETAGRAIRAQEVMGITAQMLADFRAWRPGAGQPPKTLTRRGAVWYEKIVAPVLLALAERRDGEFPLSVENGSALPYLPEGAVVEVLTPIVEGRPGAPRRAHLPVDVQALLHRNCAYEMLAAEAIAEKDRRKALRALTSNLMVTHYHQAGRLLDLLWPAERRPEKPTGSRLKPDPEGRRGE
jgi:6-phospho-beta-glucosidase